MCLPDFQERNNQPAVAIETDAPPPPALSEEEVMAARLLADAEHLETHMVMYDGDRLDLIEHVILGEFTAEQIADLYLHKVLHENGQQFDRVEFIEHITVAQERFQTQSGRIYLEYLTQRYQLR